MKTFFVAVLLLAAVVGSQAAYANTTLATGWKNCGDSSYTAQNLQVTISPANPQPGDSYTYTSSYDLTKPVETGSTETIKLTLRGIPVENKTTDLCTALAKTDTPCPIAAGHVTSVTKGTIPTDAPSGTLIATASWKDQAGNNVLPSSSSFTSNKRLAAALVLRVFAGSAPRMVSPTLYRVW